MSIGIHDLARQIKSLRETMQKIFTDDFREQLNSLLNNINQTIGNPEFQKNTAEVIAQIKDALSSINNSGIIEHTDALIKRIKTILDNINNEEMAGVFKDIATLIHRVIETDAIGKVAKMLDTINSLSGLKKFAEFLTSSGAVLFGAAGPLGTLLLKLIGKGLDTNQDAVLKQILDLEKENFFINIMQLRTQSSSNYMNAVKIQYMPGHELIPENKLRRIIDEEHHAEKMLALPMMDPETIECLKLAVAQCELLITSLHNPTEEAKKVDAVLDNICITATRNPNWLEIVRRSVFQLKEFNDGIIFPREDLSYKQAQRFYGHENVSIVMKEMASKIAKSGGDDLYYAVANTLGSAPDEFKDLIHSIPYDLETREGVLQQHTEKCRLAANTLSAFYHGDTRGAFHFTTEKWNNLRRTNPNLPALTEEASRVIILRALLEYARTTGRYFFAPHNLLREVGNGTFDFFSGIFNTVRHPINTSTLPYDLITDRNERRTALGSALYNHPTRVATSLLITGGASVVPAGGIGGLHATSAATTPTTHSLISSHTPLLSISAHPALASAAHPMLVYANTSSSISMMANMSNIANQNDAAEEKHDNTSIPESKKLNHGTDFDLDKALEQAKKSHNILTEIAQKYHIDISDPVSRSSVNDKQSRYSLFHQNNINNRMQPSKSDSELPKEQSYKISGRK